MADTPHALLRYVDARVRRDKAVPGFVGRVAIGVKAARGQTAWWIADFGARNAETRFDVDKPQTYSVAVGLDDNGARALLGLPSVDDKRPPMQLVAGDRAFLRKFVDRYLRDVSPTQRRIGAMTTKAAKTKQKAGGAR